MFGKNVNGLDIVPSNGSTGQQDNFFYIEAFHNERPGGRAAADCRSRLPHAIHGPPRQMED